MAMVTPTTKMMASGHRKMPPSLKKLTNPFRKSTSALLCETDPGKPGAGAQSSARLRYISDKNCESLLRLVCGRRGRRGPGFEVAVLSAKYVTVDRLEHFVEQAVHRAPDEIAEFCTAPGHD